jgi:hypothetical protein
MRRIVSMSSRRYILFLRCTNLLRLLYKSSCAATSNTSLKMSHLLSDQLGD